MISFVATANSPMYYDRKNYGRDYNWKGNHGGYKWKNDRRDNNRRDNRGGYNWKGGRGSYNWRKYN